MSVISSLFWLSCTAVVVLFASLDVGLGTQAYLGLGAVAAIVLMNLLRPAGWLRFAVLIFALFVSLRYLLWRYIETLPPLETVSFAVGLLLLLAETHGFAMHALGMFTNAKPRQRKPVPLPDDENALPSVDVFIPTYDEPVDLVRQTILAATQLHYPRRKLKVHVLDDGGTAARVWAKPANGERAEALREVCVAAGAVYRTRTENVDAKAGNINTALRDTTGDLVLVLDCDHIPTADFLQQTVGLFVQDPALAFVQTPHFFRNPDPIERNLDTFEHMPSEGEMFYGHTLKGMDEWNAAFFCGSAALLSRHALEAVGGISVNSVTEDADTALNMHAAGFTSAYLDRPMVAGVAPDTFAAFVQQRTRWCQGMLQILLLNNPLTKPGLRPAQRLAYTNSLVFWLFSLTRLTFLLVPISFIVFNLEIIDATFPEFVAFIAPHIFISLALNNFLYGKFRLPFVSDVYETAQSLFLTPAIFAVLRNPRRPDWKVTPKNEAVTHDFFSQLAWPLGVLAAVILATEVFAVWRLLNEPVNAQHLAIVLMWNTINLIVVTVAFGATFERGSLAHRLWMPVRSRAVIKRGADNVPAMIHASNGDQAELVLPATDRLRLIRGDRLALTVEHDTETVGKALVAAVVDTLKHRDGSARYRIAFDHPDLAAERTKIALLYGSSDRWVAFLESRRHRRGLLPGLGLLAYLGLRQLALMIAAPRAGSRSQRARPATGRPAPSTPLPAGGLAMLVLMVVLLWSTAALSADASAAETAEAAPTQGHLVTLGSLTRDGAVAPLDVANPRADFEFVLTPDVELQDITLDLGWVSSPALPADPAGLELRLNDEVVERMPVFPDGRQHDARISLPREAVTQGTNTLSLVARYADRLRCGNATTETWTSLSPRRSFLALKTTTRGTSPTLSDLDTAGWRWGIEDRGVTLLTAQRPDDALLTLGGNLAGALALRRDQPGLVVGHAVVAPMAGNTAGSRTVRIKPTDLAPGLNVLFGSADDLAPLLDEDVAARIDRPVVGVHHFDTAPESLLVILSGRTATEVHMAAAALANRNLMLPEATWAELPQTLAPTTVRSRSIQERRVYRFDTPEIMQFDPEEQRLEIMMPAGFVALDNRKMDLLLDFAYAPGLPAGAVLEVRVNDRVVRQVKLDDPSGAVVQARRIRLELASFRPGGNTIGFRAGVVGTEFDECSVAPRGWFEVFAGSRLRVPALLDVSRQPDLRLLAAPEGPFARRGGRDLGIVVANADPRVTGAAWTFAARLASSHGQPLAQLEIRAGTDARRRHSIWFGTAGQLDGRTAAASGLADVILGEADFQQDAGLPATLGGRRHLEWQRQLEEFQGDTRWQPLVGRIGEALGVDELRARLPLDGLAADQLAAWQTRLEAFFRLDNVAELTRLPNDRSFDAAIAGMPRRTPAGTVGSDLHVVALDAETLERAVAEIVRTDKWQQLEGTAAAWQVRDITIATAAPVKPIETPTDLSLSGFILHQANLLGGQPSRWFLIVVGGVVVLGGCVAHAMRGARD